MDLTGYVWVSGSGHFFLPHFSPFTSSCHFHHHHSASPWRQDCTASCGHILSLCCLSADLTGNSRLQIQYLCKYPTTTVLTHMKMKMTETKQTCHTEYLSEDSLKLLLDFVKWSLSNCKWHLPPITMRSITGLCHLWHDRCPVEIWKCALTNGDIQHIQLVNKLCEFVPSHTHSYTVH